MDIRTWTRPAAFILALAPDFAIYMKAAAVARPVLEANPTHPGAAHYIIHAFDDPVHAPLGLQAARAYSQIAPDAGHAEGMAACIARMSDNPARDEAGYFVNMRARAVIDAGDWSQADNVTADLGTFPQLALPYDFVDALAALRTGNIGAARRLRERHGDPAAASDPQHAILLLELDGLIALADGNTEAGLALLRDAASREEALPYEFGPPATLMPPHELLATELAALDRHDEARRAWDAQLARTPMRTQSLLGLARTAVALGDDTAAREAYAALAEVWAGADREVPGLEEARTQTSSR